MKTTFLRNEDGYFVNTQAFSDAADHFKKYGRYTDYSAGSSGWFDFWKQELDKKINGVKIGGVQITGDHYNYINYTRIKRIPTVIEKKNGIFSKRVRKIVDFPSFYDGDYDFFWNVQISEFGCTEKFLNGLKLFNVPKFYDGGRNMIVNKARRKGYSYKMASLASNRYDTVPDALIIICAYDKKFLYGRRGIFDFVRANCDFYNSYTAWKKLREKMDTKDSIKASYIEKDVLTGIGVERGFMSQISSASFHDDPDALRGVDFDLGIIEEIGTFKNWSEAFHAIMPAQEAGMFKSGMMIGFGTGGENDSSAIIDFSEHFYEAELFGYNCYKNVWDKTPTKDCGYFHPDWMGKEGFVDENGNSLKEKAIAHEAEERSKLKKANKNKDLIKHIVEHAQNPSEAFMAIGYNPYPVELIKPHLEDVLARDLFSKTATPVSFYNNGGGWTYRVILDGSASPYIEYPVKNFEAGCPIMYAPPDPSLPFGSYLAGLDPYNQDTTVYSDSIGGLTIYCPDYGKGSGIVLTYYGRPTVDDYLDNIIAILETYRCQVMHENVSPIVFKHFEKRKKLHLLADKPDYFLKKVHKSSNVGRTKGCHMDGEIRRTAEKYDRDWMMTPRGDGLLNLHTITDIGLLREYLKYDGGNNVNTDRVDSVLHMRIHASEHEHILVEQTGNNDDIYDKIAEYFN